MKVQKKSSCLIVSIFILFLLAGCSQPTETVKEPGIKHTADMVILTPEAIRQNGIQIMSLDEKQAGAELFTTGEIRVDESRVFHFRSPVSGRITRENVMLGDKVRKGQALAYVQNLDVIRIHGEYIHQLHQNQMDVEQAKTRLQLTKEILHREEALLKEGITPRKDYEQAYAEERMAASQYDGLKEHAIHIRSEAKALLGAYGLRLGNTNGETIQTNSPLISPRAGIVTQKLVTQGEVTSPDQMLYEVTDLEKVWLDMTIYPKDITKVRLGQSVEFISDGLPGKVFQGTINYFQPLGTDSNHTFLARAFLKNPGMELKPGMFGRVTIRQARPQSKLFLPEVALQSQGGERFVFIDQGNGQFHKQSIELGEKVPGGYLVESGLRVRDRIVGAGSFTLKAELLKSQQAEEE